MTLKIAQRTPKWGQLRRMNSKDERRGTIEEIYAQGGSRVL